MPNEPSPAFAFILDYLRRNKKASFAEVRDAAAQDGFTIYPISYGKAQALLGLVASAKRGQGQAARATAAKKAARRGPGRPRKGAAKAATPRRGGRRKADAPPSANGRRNAGGTDDILGGIANEIRALRQDRDRLRQALEELRDMVDAAV